MPADLARTTYDQIAGHYDEVWSRFVEWPQRQLTSDLELRVGDRIADCACGTGLHTIAMLERVAPAEVVAVDCSPAMLEIANARASSKGLHLTTVVSDMASFVDRADTGVFDVVSIRFGLAYLDWGQYLPRLGRLLRPGGRVGVLTSLASSVPQAYAVYVRLARQFHLPVVSLPVPSQASDIHAALARGGLEPGRHWVHRFRLWFDGGYDAAKWLRNSGYVTHPALGRVAPAILERLVRTFARQLEAEFGGARGVPLDLEVAGVIATAPG